MRGGRAVVLAALALLASSARAEDFPVPAIPCAPRQYVCRRAPAPLVVDGALDDAAWRDAAWTEPFVDIEGAAKSAPRFLTRAKLLWDDDNLYVGAELEEPDLWGALTERDAVIFHDNDFELFIDPDGDTHEYYELEINALATVWDLLLIRPYRDGDRWRLNFSRVEWRARADGGGYAKVVDPATGKPLPEDNWVWSPQGLIAMHYPEMWGVVQFSTVPAGAAAVAPRDDPADATRWTLRRIYYAQRRFQMAHGRFATDLIALGLADLAANGTAPPVIEATTSRFEARAGEAPGEPTLAIDATGRLRALAGSLPTAR